MGQIVPEGAEGSIFALVSSLQTVGSTVGGSLSAILTSSLGVTLTDYDNLALLVRPHKSAKALPLSCASSALRGQSHCSS